jgi:hypothetical protein
LDEEVEGQQGGGRKPIFWVLPSVSSSSLNFCGFGSRIFLRCGIFMVVEVLGCGA